MSSTNTSVSSSLSLTRRPRLLVIHNPTAGWRRRRLLRLVLRALEARGAAITLRETARRGDAEAFARAARAEEFDRVVVAGGDGTINETINGLADPRLPLGIVPLGTANVLAAEIGLAGGVAAIAAAILDGPSRPVALGRVRAGTVSRRFVMMAGVGFDAQVVARVDPRLKRLTGKFAYVVASLRQIVRAAGHYYEITVDGRRHRVASAIIANGHYYGGKFVAAREARLDESCLHVCLFGRAGRWNVMRYATALMLGQLHRLGDVTVIRAQRVEISGPLEETLQVDGDVDGHLPAVIEVETGALSLAMPPEAASVDRLIAAAA